MLVQPPPPPPPQLLYKHIIIIQIRCAFNLIAGVEFCFHSFFDKQSNQVFVVVVVVLASFVCLF